MEASIIDRAMARLERHRWLRHGLFWLVNNLFFAWYVVAVKLIDKPDLAIRDAFLFLLPFMLATYSLLYIVVPAYWQGRFRRFGLLLLGWLVGCLLLNYGFRYFILNPMRQGYEVPTNADFFNTFSSGTYILLIATAGVAAVTKLGRRWYQQERANQQLLTENITAELQLLKAQVHPHFLFNTLNNLYALTLKQSDQAPEVVKRLSGLLHYMTSECTAPEVPLTKEVLVLQQYIQLEQLRYGHRLQVDLDITGPLDGYRLPPLLLLPFVDNAFKHGSAEQLAQARISLRLSVQAGWLHFNLTNTQNACPKPLKPDHQGGIGLQNVRQRLTLLFPATYQLAIVPQVGLFSVSLTFPLRSL